MQGDRECSYYMKTGQCKFGVTCKFDHPQSANVQVPAAASTAIAVQVPAAITPPIMYPTVPHVTAPSQQFSALAGSWQLARPPMMPGSYIQGSFGPMLYPSGVVPVSGWSPYTVSDKYCRIPIMPLHVSEPWSNLFALKFRHLLVHCLHLRLNLLLGLVKSMGCHPCLLLCLCIMELIRLSLLLLVLRVVPRMNHLILKDLINLTVSITWGLGNASMVRSVDTITLQIGVHTEQVLLLLPWVFHFARYAFFCILYCSAPMTLFHVLNGCDLWVAPLAVNARVVLATEACFLLLSFCWICLLLSYS